MDIPAVAMILSLVSLSCMIITESEIDLTFLFHLKFLTKTFYTLHKIRNIG